ncbi:MAG: DUF2779 domain-containing protein [Patescibacteria group bacterium]
MMFLKHPAWLWIKKHAKTLLPPTDPATQAIFDTGHEFEKYAEALFPGGVTLGFSDYDEYLSLPERTTQVLDEGVTTIFQGRFEHEQITFICDVMQVVGNKEVDLIEIKSSTSAKPEHSVDLAFQMVVLEKCGYSVRNITVIHVNNQYVRNGAIDAKEITSRSDVTEDVKAARDFTITKIDEALETMALNECPDVSPLYADSKSFGEWLQIYKHLKGPKSGSIFDLCQMDAKALQNLQANNITLIKDIPADFVLKPKQRLQVEALHQGHPTVHADKIKEFLSSFTYPLYFFDYETLRSLVPYFDRLKPYQQLPFQYSLHLLDSPDSELRHEEFLHRDNSNPAEPLTQALISQIGDSGTIVTWNMGFEKSCNSLLAELLPEHAEFYTKLNDRIVDLMTPFSSNWYVDANFCGSASIKNVLPVLVPELSHKLLDISDGSTAQRLWMEAVLDRKHPDDKEKILSDLLEYCKLDTLAMVEIYKVLKGL